MLKGLGLVFLSVVIGSAIAWLSSLLGSNFTIEYAKNSSIEVLSTIFALNVATATFLIGGLLNIEERLKEPAFNKARDEIRHNLYAMAFIFALNLLFVSMISNTTRKLLGNIELNDLLGVMSIASLFFYLYLLLEVVSGALKVSIPSKKDKQE